MAINIRKWDQRILEDYDSFLPYHNKWRINRDLLNNEKSGERYGNLIAEYGRSIRARLLSEQFAIRVRSDDPDNARIANELSIMAMSLARSVDLKDVLDEATEHALWSGTGWLEVGHSFDLHSLDPSRTFLYKNENFFDPSSMEDEYVPVDETSVQATLGSDIENVAPFDPFEKQNIVDEDTSVSVFDPNFGVPWIHAVSPFFLVYPPESKFDSDCDYITRLRVVSVEELEEMTGNRYEVSFDSRFDVLLDETPGGRHIDNPVVVAITYIRRDRNNPSASGWYLAHIIGTDIVIKSSPNPYGGMVPFIAAKSSMSRKLLCKSWVEDMRVNADWYAKIIEGAFRRISLSLSVKWSVDGRGSIDKRNTARLNDPDYFGRIDFENAPAEALKYIEGPGLSQDIIAAVNLASKLAQSSAGQTDLDRGTPVKKITARQTEALLQASDLMFSTLRKPIIQAGSQSVLKLVHLLNLFSPSRPHVFSFGDSFVELEPGGNDWTTSFKYSIDIRDAEGPANAEQQLLIVQFLSRVAALPQFQSVANFPELYDHARRAFGFGPEVTATYAGQPATMGPMQPTPGQTPTNGVPSFQMEEHPERLLGDQGTPDVSAALAGMFNSR